VRLWFGKMPNKRQHNAGGHATAHKHWAIVCLPC
jgi:hypothetical protein